MVALKSERYVYMWRVTTAPSPKDAPKAVSLSEIMGLIKTSYAAGQAQLYLSGDGRVLAPDAPDADKDPKNRVYIAEISEARDTYTLLINRGDPFAAAPAFINATSDEVRTVPPGRDESQGWSAHLVISKSQASNTYRACFERMQHVTAWYVEILFRDILERQAEGNAKYTYKKRVKRGKASVEETRTYRPSLSIKKVPSEQIKEDLEKGELSSITLIEHHPKFSGIDSPEVIQSIKNKISITPKPVDKSSLIKFIEGITKWGKSKGFDEIQLQIRNLPGNATASPRFLIEKEDATETLYVRTQRLTGFSAELERCYAQIAPEIQDKMIDLINDSGKW